MLRNPYRQHPVAEFVEARTSGDELRAPKLRSKYEAQERRWPKRVLLLLWKLGTSLVTGVACNFVLT